MPYPICATNIDRRAANRLLFSHAIEFSVFAPDRDSMHALSRILTLTKPYTVGGRPPWQEDTNNPKWISRITEYGVR